MKKKIAVAVLIFLVLIALLIWVYNLVQAKHWQEQNHAENLARQKAGLVHEDAVDWFSGDGSYIIVFGRDRNNQKMIVWVGNNELHKEAAKDGLSKADVVGKVSRAYPGAVMIHAVPGKYVGDYVWEAYFKVTKQGKTNYYYQYYKFSDGELLDTLNMGE